MTDSAPERVQRLLVTGGAGFLGSHFVDHWLSLDPQHFVVVLDALTYAGDREYLSLADPQRMVFVHGDICQPDLALQLLGDHQLQGIAHFAAESHVDRSLTDPAIFVRTNVLGTQHLLEAARSLWLNQSNRPHRFHQVSTDEVYGQLSPGESAWVEGTAFAPNSPYSASKAAADHLVRAYHHSFGLQVSWTHSCNAYGPRQYPEKLIPAALRCWQTNQPAPLYAGGHQIREWMHVRDQVRGVALAILLGTPGRAYHLGGATACSNRELLRLLWQQCQLANSASMDGDFDQWIETVADRAGHDQAYGLNGKRAKTELGFSPAIDLAAGLVETSAWYLKCGL
jgi:dTDP-glucose 4,6-dehydratase